MNPIQVWLDALKKPVPWILCDPKASESLALAQSLSLAIQQSATGIDAPIEALLYMRIGCMEPSHENVQNAKRGLGAYIHGVLHRMEGDYWNANYWFDRVQDPKLLERISDHISQLAKAHGLTVPIWSGPSNFVEACKASRSEPDEALEVLAQWEWQALWRIANEKNPR